MTPDSVPPSPPTEGAMAVSRRLELEADDGNRLAARLALTAGRAAGVVVLPDVRGLHPYYERLAEALAGAGRHALAIDPYGRTAGAQYRDEHFDHKAHRAHLRDAGVRADVRAAAAALRAEGADAVFVWGFCAGGRGAFQQASQPGIDGVIGCYGWPARREEGGTSPIDEAERGLVRAPVLALYGGADEGIGPEDRAAYEHALAASGATAETVTYEGAPHSFFDRRMADHAGACADVWERVLDFTAGAMPRR